MKNNHPKILTALIFALIIAGCKKQEKVVSPPVPGNELITTIKIRLQNTANPNDTIWAIWRDISNGAHPADTSKAIINLKISSSYHASVYFFDETKNPAEDITPDIRARSNFHSYWFLKTGALNSNLTVTPTDHDTNNPPLPVGLEDSFVTSSLAAAGRLEGVLRHQPNSKNGTFAPGSTDSDVFFLVNILP